MNIRRQIYPTVLAPLLLAGFAVVAEAQVAVDDAGEPFGEYAPAYPEAAIGNEDIPLLAAAELQDLVGPIALYPDDLLAIVLPASTYPLQLVQAQRFLDDLDENPSLTPDEDWDDSVVALLNYPEALALLNEDLDWTWRLGEAVVGQQADVVAAVEQFRDRAYAAGNLQSDTHQTVARNDGTIEITPVEDDVIYVPYYEPEAVVVYQPRPVYYYYPRAYPVYYYPYPDSYAFNRGYFWGVTTAFTVGWLTDSVHVYHHSYHGHPYYGHYYPSRWWYRRPTVNVYNTVYVNNNVRVTRNRYYDGDHWRPRHETRRRLSDQRITRSTFYTSNRERSRPRTSQWTGTRDTTNRSISRDNTSRRQASVERLALNDQRSRKPVTRQPTTRERGTPDRGTTQRNTTQRSTRDTPAPRATPRAAPRQMPERQRSERPSQDRVQRQPDSRPAPAPQRQSEARPSQSRQPAERRNSAASDNRGERGSSRQRSGGNERQSRRRN